MPPCAPDVAVDADVADALSGNEVLREFTAEAQRMPPLTRRLLLHGAADGIEEGCLAGPSDTADSDDVADHNHGGSGGGSVDPYALIEELALPPADLTAAL